MEKKLIKVYCGEGTGKSNAALGRALVAASEGREVFIVQFLKGGLLGNPEYFSKLEPDIMVFRFEQAARFYDQLSDTEKAEENNNILNGIHFACKVLKIEECDTLILDEVLGLVDFGIITADELIDMVKMKPESMELILTGRRLPQALIPYADVISEMCCVKPAADSMMTG